MCLLSLVFHIRLVFFFSLSFNNIVKYFFLKKGGPVILVGHSGLWAIIANNTLNTRPPAKTAWCENKLKTLLNRMSFLPHTLEAINIHMVSLLTTNVKTQKLIGVSREKAKDQPSRVSQLKHVWDIVAPIYALALETLLHQLSSPPLQRGSCQGFHVQQWRIYFCVIPQWQVFWLNAWKVVDLSGPFGWMDSSICTLGVFGPDLPPEKKLVRSTGKDQQSQWACPWRAEQKYATYILLNFTLLSAMIIRGHSSTCYPPFLWRGADFPAPHIDKGFNHISFLSANMPWQIIPQPSDVSQHRKHFFLELVEGA